VGVGAVVDADDVVLLRRNRRFMSSIVEFSSLSVYVEDGGEGGAGNFVRVTLEPG
jgi:hypothetical protein